MMGLFMKWLLAFYPSTRAFRTEVIKALTPTNAEKTNPKGYFLRHADSGLRVTLGGQLS